MVYRYHHHDISPNNGPVMSVDCQSVLAISYGLFKLKVTLIKLTSFLILILLDNFEITVCPNTHIAKSSTIIY